MNTKKLSVLMLLLQFTAFAVYAAPIGLFGSDLIADIAEKASPAVVAIESVHYVRTPSVGSGDPFFDRFFSYLFEEDFTGRNNVIPQKGSGSGVFISPKGYLLTNEHVIAGADEICVNLGSGKKYKARVIGKDIKTDLAVLKVDSDEEFLCVPLGDSSKVRVGEWAVAIGNPFALGITVTAGVISALHRDLSVDKERSYNDLIQTDASINPGNSGGALLNTKGELIGINTAIMPYGQGIGFAIPINPAKRIVGDLMAYGRVKKAFLGVTVQGITKELAQYFEIPLEGVLVTDVTSASAADESGIVPGDVIVAIQGVPIKNISDFHKALDAKRVGEEAQIKIFRKGKEGSCKVLFKESPAAGNVLGVAIKTINRKLERRYSLYVSEGCVITMVADSSPAAGAGLRAGDVIQAVNRVPTLSESSFNKVLAKIKPPCQILLRVVRGQTVNLLLVNADCHGQP